MCSPETRKDVIALESHLLLQRETTMSRLAAATTFTDVRIILTQRFVLQDFQLRVQSLVKELIRIREAKAGD